MSTGLNCMSGLIYEDIIKPLLKKPLSAIAASRLMRALVVIIGLTCMGFVFLVEKLNSIFQVIIYFITNNKNYYFFNYYNFLDCA